MKNVYIIGGTMGVGKTTVSEILNKRLSNSVFLDGDWCWNANPFHVTDETKAMVIDNICHLLNNFIKCSSYENIIFCWVMHRQDIIDSILSRIESNECKIHCISLVCDEAIIVKRLKEDVKKGLRTDDIIEKSVMRIPLYDSLDTEKIDVSNISAERAADIIANL